jgi:hypothetical protein
MNMGLTTPHLEAFAVARGSAGAIFSVLDRVPDIDSLSKTGEKPPGLRGDIKFEGVHFQYPARLEFKVGVIFVLQKLLQQKLHHVFDRILTNLTAFPVWCLFLSAHTSQVYCEGAL